MKYFKNYIILLLTLILFTSCKDSNSVIFKPDFNILIDGLFNDEDWNGAKFINFNSNVTLYLIQNKTDLYLGIRNKDDASRYVDLYIDNDSIGTINLHASMQLSERILRNKWNDTIPKWNWGNNTQWIANKVEILNTDKNISFQESLKHYQGYEFKISKHKIKSKESRIRIEIKDFEGKAYDIIFPLNSERKNKEKWYSLILE